MLVYKATDKNMECRGFQYEIGKTYETDRAKLCECGFHGYISAVDALNHYNPAESRFFVAVLDEVTDEVGDDSKRVGKRITLLHEISVSDESVFDHVEFDREIESSSNARNYGTGNAGYCGTASARDWGMANVGEYGTANVGSYAVARSEGAGSASVGESGTAVGYGKNARVRGNGTSV